MIDPNRYKYLQKEPELKERTVTLASTLNTDERSRNMKLLLRYRTMWDNMAEFRRRRQRNKDYANGNQWNDLIEVAPGKFITEAQNISMQGKVPLKNNVISHLVDTVIGTFRENYGMPEVTARVRENQVIGEMNTNMLEYLYQKNEIKELDVKDLREYMYSGCVCHMTDYCYDRKSERNEEYVVSWNPTRLILPNNIQDPRGYDIRSVGVIMDMSLDEVVQKFARSEKDEEKIKEIYKYYDKDDITYAYRTLSRSRIEGTMDFFCPTKRDECRVIQMWEKESERSLLVTDHLEGSVTMYPWEDKTEVERMKKERDDEISLNNLDHDKAGMEVEYTRDEFWYVRYFSPFGDILYEGRTPFSHNDHPFTVLLGHLIDGEVHSYVENIIDQQRYINRLITLSDFIMGASAKGLLIFPEAAIPKDMNKEDILEQWNSYRGVIFANIKPGMQLPTQISSKATTAGLNEMLSIQLQLIRDIAGVHGAIQGKDAKSGQSATLYQQESLNAQTNMKDLIESFIAFRRRRDYKLIMVAPQCYEDEFYMAVSGAHEDAQMWNPVIAKSAPLYVQISETNNTVVYRSMMNEFLLKAMEMRMTDLKTVLKAGTFPYADKLLRVVEEQEKEAMKQQAELQANQLQGQALGQQMLENGATQGQVLQAGADIAQQELQNNGEQSIEQMAAQADPKAMEMLQQAMM